MRVAVSLVAIELRGHAWGASLLRASVSRLLWVRVLGASLLRDDSLLHVSSFLVPVFVLVLRKFFGLRMSRRVEG